MPPRDTGRTIHGHGPDRPPPLMCTSHTAQSDSAPNDSVQSVLYKWRTAGPLKAALPRASGSSVPKGLPDARTRRDRNTVSVSLLRPLAEDSKDMNFGGFS